MLDLGAGGAFKLNGKGIHSEDGEGEAAGGSGSGERSMRVKTIEDVEDIGEFNRDRRSLGFRTKAQSILAELKSSAAGSIC